MKRNVVAGWVVMLLCALAAAAAAAPPVGGADSGEDLALLRRTSKAFSSVARKAMPAIVFIQVEKNIEAQVMGGRRPRHYDPQDFYGDEFLRRFFGVPEEQEPRLRRFRQVAQGSGFLITRDGYILTNNHVVGDADKIRVKLHDGRQMEAKRIGSDPKTEVAVIKIEGGPFPYLEPGDSGALEIGEWVIAIGNPFGLAETLTVGVVSAKGRNPGIADYEDFIQTDAAINPGNSGGPLLNIDGQVVGINTAIFSQNGGYMGIGFAIPINMVESIRKQLVATGSVRRGYLGVAIQDMTPELAESLGLGKAEGILVADVERGSPADKAGLQQADVIQKLNGDPVGKVGRFRNRISSMAPGKEIALTVRRDDRTLELKARTAELPGEAAESSSGLYEKLGISVAPLDRETARRYEYDLNEGLLVTGVAPDSAAAEVGIEPGCLISSVNRRRVNNPAEFKSALTVSGESGLVLLRVKSGRVSRYIVLRLDD